MNRHLRISLLAVAALCALPAAGQKVYRWVDEHGNVHFGDRIPPEYADRDRAVLNEQGITVDRQEGALSEEELAAIEAQKEREAAEEAARAEVARHDRMLLQTYLTVDDIVDLRDRRLEQLESRITVTELYLADLKERHAGLMKEASRYEPYAEAENAPPIPHDLAGELATTESSISTYEQSIEQTRAEQAKLKAQFDNDIERFKILKGY